MRLSFETQLASLYKSQSQKVRILTEGWVVTQVYCPNCGSINIDKYPNNQPVADFHCLSCREDYELKSKNGLVGTKIVNGAYGTMIERLRSNKNPNLFLLSYDSSSFEVLNFLVVPKQFFIPGIIEKRKPLAPTARRAGWIGCNIMLQNLPSVGKIFLIKNRAIEPKEKVLFQWQKTLFLRDEKRISSKGWTLDVIKCIEQINKPVFTIDDLYAFERDLMTKYPDNRHIKDKIRQQLQILRDKGYLEFSNRGNYRLI